MPAPLLAENRLVNFNSGNGIYAYSGLNLRLTRANAGATTTYIYAGNNVLAEYIGNASPQYPGREYFYAGNQLIGNVSNSYKRDTESFNDYALNRFYSNRLGRFTQPDKLDVPYLNPQALNRFTYTTNDPVNELDPLGLIDCAPSTEGVGSKGTCVSVTTDAPPPIDYFFFSPFAGGNPPIITSLGGQFGGRPMPNPKPSSPNSNPCANSTLAAANVNINQRISEANRRTLIGAMVGLLFGQTYIGALAGYGSAVRKGGPQDDFNLTGSPVYQSQAGLDAGNVSYGVTCPFGPGLCQFVAGAAQSVFALSPDPNGTLKTGFDTPRDNQMIRVGQEMRATGCH